MNRQEMISAMADVFRQPHVKCHELLDSHLEASLHAIYIKDRFDKLFVGIERHTTFMAWVKEHQPLVIRYHRLRTRSTNNKRNRIQTAIWRLEAQLAMIV